MIFEKILGPLAAITTVTALLAGAYGYIQSGRAEAAQAELGRVTAEYALLTKLQEKTRKLAEEGANLAVAQQKVIDDKTIEAINANSRAERERINGLQQRAKDRAASEAQVAGISRAIQEATSFESLAVSAGVALKRCGVLLANGVSLLGEAARVADENAAIAISAQTDRNACRKAVDDIGQ